MQQTRYSFIPLISKFVSLVFTLPVQFSIAWHIKAYVVGTAQIHALPDRYNETFTIVKTITKGKHFAGSFARNETTNTA